MFNSFQGFLDGPVDLEYVYKAAAPAPRRKGPAGGGRQAVEKAVIVRQTQQESSPENQEMQQNLVVRASGEALHRIPIMKVAENQDDQNDEVEQLQRQIRRTSGASQDSDALIDTYIKPYQSQQRNGSSEAGRLLNQGRSGANATQKTVSGWGGERGSLSRSREASRGRSGDRQRMLNTTKVIHEDLSQNSQELVDLQAHEVNNEIKDNQLHDTVIEYFSKLTGGDIGNFSKITEQEIDQEYTQRKQRENKTSPKPEADLSYDQIENIVFKQRIPSKPSPDKLISEPHSSTLMVDKIKAEHNITLESKYYKHADSNQRSHQISKTYEHNDITHLILREDQQDAADNEVAQASPLKHADDSHKYFHENQADQLRYDDENEIQQKDTALQNVSERRESGENLEQQENAVSDSMKDDNLLDAKMISTKDEEAFVESHQSINSQNQDERNHNTNKTEELLEELDEINALARSRRQTQGHVEQQPVPLKAKKALSIERQQKNFVEQQIKWLKQRNERLSIAQNIREYEDMKEMKQARNPANKKYTQSNDKVGFSNSDYYKVVVNKYRDSKRTYELQSEEARPLDQKVYTFKPKITNNSKILAKVKINELDQREMNVEERLLYRGKEYAGKIQMEKERQVKETSQNRSFVNRVSEQYLLQSSDPWNSRRAGLREHSPLRDDSIENDRAPHSPRSNGSLNDDDQPLDDAAKVTITTIGAKKDRSNSRKQNNLSQTQNIDEIKENRKGPKHQTYLYEMAKFQSEVQAQRLQEQRNNELKEIQDRPKIDLNSKRMVKGNEQHIRNVHNRLYQSKIKAADEAAAPKQEDVESKSRINEFIDRNYKASIEQKENKIKRIQESEDQKLADMFKPALSKGSKQLMKSKYKGVDGHHGTSLPSFEEMYREAKILREKKQRMAEESTKKKEAKEMENSTFKPKINRLKYLTTKSSIPKQEDQGLRDKSPQLIKNIESYLDRHLYKKNNGFLKQKEIQENKWQQQKNKFTDLSNNMLKEVQEKKNLMNDPSKPKTSIDEANESLKQFNMIESFLKTLTLSNEKELKDSGANFQSQRQFQVANSMPPMISMIEQINKTEVKNEHKDIDAVSKETDTKEVNDQRASGTSPAVKILANHLNKTYDILKSHENVLSFMSAHSGDVKIMDEATMAMQEFEKFNQFNMDKLDAKDLSNINVDHFDQKTNQLEYDNPFEVDRDFDEPKDCLTPKRNAFHGLKMKQQMLIQSNASAPSNRIGDENSMQGHVDTSSKKSMIEPKYMQIIEAADNKLGTSDLTENLEQASDTDLRRGGQSSMKSKRNVESANVSSKQNPQNERQNNTVYSQIQNKNQQHMEMHKNTQNHDQQETIGTQELEFEKHVTIESPSPHKKENFKNLEPQQKSRSTKKYEYSVSNNPLNYAHDFNAQSDSIPFQGMDHGQSEMILTDSNLDQDSQVSPNKMMKYTNPLWKNTTNEIQIQENSLDEDDSNVSMNPNKITQRMDPLNERNKKESGSSALQNQEAEGGPSPSNTDEKFDTADDDDNSQTYKSYEIENHEDVLQQPELAYDAADGEEKTINIDSLENVHIEEANEDIDNYSSPDNRVNNSLSLIEEVDNEDSASVQQPMGSVAGGNIDNGNGASLDHTQNSKFIKTGGVDMRSLNSQTASPHNDTRRSNQEEGENQMDDQEINFVNANGESRSLAHNYGKDVNAGDGQQSSIEEMELDDKCPELVRDIVNMEKSFIQFLSAIYD